MLTNALQSNLKALLDRRRISIREFARMIDYRFETVRLLYNNELTRVPIELMERICTELNCTLNDLFTVVQEPKGVKR